MPQTDILGKTCGWFFNNSLTCNQNVKITKLCNTFYICRSPITEGVRHARRLQLTARIGVRRWVQKYVIYFDFHFTIYCFFSGKPIVAVALFGDQYRNGRSAERNHFGVLFDKTTISGPNLAKALQQILGNEKYAK